MNPIMRTPMCILYEHKRRGSTGAFAQVFIISPLSFAWMDSEIAVLGTVKPVLSGHPKRKQKLVFKIDYRLMQVKFIAECSNGSILQYFRPSLSYHLSSGSFLLCLFLIGRLRQFLLHLLFISKILFSQ